MKKTRMNGIALSDEQKELKALAAAFAHNVVATHVEEMDRTNNYPWLVVEALARDGFMGMTLPEKYGGDDTTGRGMAGTSAISPRPEGSAQICTAQR